MRQSKTSAAHFAPQASAVRQIPSTPHAPQAAPLNVTELTQWFRRPARGGRDGHLDNFTWRFWGLADGLCRRGDAL